ncbi:MAG TPA: ribonuclease HI [Firmicutes bacterium]|nr:ribonuclease HI [Bacillota bacterium]
MKEVIVYTDGACSGNPGPGGWGALLIYGNHRRELSGYERETTNQRMELKAAVEALKAIKEPCRIKLYSDSAYLVNAFNKSWFAAWEKNKWLTAKKTPVANEDLWRELLALAQKHEIKWIKVKGHGSNEGNNRCDELAREEITKNRGGD